MTMESEKTILNKTKDHFIKEGYKREDKGSSIVYTRKLSEEVAETIKIIENVRSHKSESVRKDEQENN